MLIRSATAAVLLMAGLCGLSPVDGQILNGRVKDAVTGEPIMGASLMIKETTIGTATGSDGLFSLSLSDVPAVLVVSHLSYNSLEITFSSFPQGKLDLSLEPSVHPLKEVEITVRKPQKMMEGKPWEILDFEFLGDYILILANMNGSIFQPAIMLTNSRGDTLAYRSIMKADELYRDFAGNVYVLTARSVYQVSYGDRGLGIEYTDERDRFMATYPVVVDVKVPQWILRSYTKENQRLSYYRYNENDSSCYLFRTIGDEAAISRSYWGPYFDGTEADLHFARVIVNKAVYAPMFRSGDELILFNYADHCIEFFDAGTEMTRQVYAPFMKEKNCMRNVIMDEQTGLFYVSFEKNGITSIYNVGLISGAAEWVCDVPGFVYIENLRIRGGEIFFLFREKNLSEQQRLYKLSIK